MLIQLYNVLTAISSNIGDSHHNLEIRQEEKHLPAIGCHGFFFITPGLTFTEKFPALLMRYFMYFSSNFDGGVLMCCVKFLNNFEVVVTVAEIKKAPRFLGA